MVLVSIPLAWGNKCGALTISRKEDLMNIRWKSLMLLLLGTILISFSGVTFAKQTTLLFSFWGTTKEVPVIEGAIKGFMDKNPDIKVKVMAVPATGWSSYFAKVVSMVAGGTPPDIARVAIEGARFFAAKGLSMPLDSYIQKDKEELQEFFDDVHPKLVEPFRYKGSLYQLPGTWNNMVIFYNTKLFEKYGIKRPPDDWNTDTFLEIARKITVDEDGDGVPDQWGFGRVSTGAFGVVPWVFNFDSNILSDDWTQSNANDPKLVAAFRWMQDLIWKYRVAPSPTGIDWYTIFATGKLGMTGWGRWPVVHFTGLEFYDYDIMYFPKATTQTTVYGINSYCIMKSAKNPDEAWRLYKYMCSKEFRRYQAKGGMSIPSRRSIAYDPEAMGPYPPHWRIFYDSLEKAKAVPSPTEYPKMEEILDRYLSSMLANEITPEEAAEGTHRELSALLAGGEE